MRVTRFSFFASVLWLSTLIGAGPASAINCPESNPCSTCNDVCDSSSGTCDIQNNRYVAVGSVIDCWSRSMIIRTGGKIVVKNGTFTLRANDLYVDGGDANQGKIEAVDSTSTGTAVGFAVEINTNLTLLGSLIASNSKGGGTIRVETGGNISIAEQGVYGVEANGTNASAPGGDITLIAGGSISINDPILAEMSGGSGSAPGGSIYLEAGTSVSQDLDGNIRVTSRDNDAGVIRVTAGTDITIRKNVIAEGKQNNGNGGGIYFEAGGSVTLTSTSNVSARGGVNVSGGNSAGGTVSIEAGCGGVSVQSSIDARGGSDNGGGYDGGSLLVTSKGNVTFSNGVAVRSYSMDNGGGGGEVIVESEEGTLQLNDNVLIDARGDTGGGALGIGGPVTLRGCTVDIKPSVIVDATGYDGGDIIIQARNVPPVTGGQPITIPSGAQLRAYGNTASGGLNGRLDIAPRVLKRGVCNTNSSVTCLLDSECPTGGGCGAPDCLYANPDTAGLNTQFNPTPERLEESSLAPCPVTCE